MRQPWSRGATLAFFAMACVVCSRPLVHDRVLLTAGENFVLPALEYSWYTACALAVGSGAFCCAAYHCNALRLDGIAANLWSSPAGVELTKTQPGKKISPKLRAEAQLWGNINAFLTGLVGAGLFVVHVRLYPWASATTKTRGFFWFSWNCVLSYLWIDLSAYVIHRMLHARRFYWLHKWHHRYTVPTAHAAFAAHPVDFLVFQVVGLVGAFTLFAPSPLAFLLVAVPVAYHNQVEHCGIRLDGEMPWTPTPQFHDDHHSKFTCNFGFEMVLWDWAFGTLRSKAVAYGDPAKGARFHDVW